MSILKNIYSLKTGNLVFSTEKLLHRQSTQSALRKSAGGCLTSHESGMSSIWRDVKFTLYLYFSFCFILFKQLLYYVICCQAFWYWVPKRTLHHLSPHPGEEHLVYWILRYFCLLTNMEDIVKVTLSHAEASQFNS